MRVDTDQFGAGAGLSPVGGTAAPRDTGDFADMLAADARRFDAVAARDAVLANQPDRKPDANADDIAEIRENGLRAYAQELHKKHMEELRAKILEKMGLSEEDLENMPADRRSVIEAMIAREIEARQAAESLTDGDGDVAGTAAGPRPNTEAAAILAAERGGLKGAAVMAAVQAGDAAERAAEAENS